MFRRLQKKCSEVSNLSILAGRNTPVLGFSANLVSAAVPVAYASILLAAVERLWNLVRR